MSTWEEGSRWAFRVDAGRLPLVRAMAEDYRLTPSGDGALLTWTLALDLAGAGRRATPLIGAVGGTVLRRAARRLERYLSRSATEG